MRRSAVGRKAEKWLGHREWQEEVQKEVKGGREGEKGQEEQMLKDGGVLMVTGKLSGVVFMGGKWGSPSGIEGRKGSERL